MTIGITGILMTNLRSDVVKGLVKKWRGMAGTSAIRDNPQLPMNRMNY